MLILVKKNIFTKIVTITRVKLIAPSQPVKKNSADLISIVSICPDVWRHPALIRFP